MADPILIYGANGYTGTLAARRAVEVGLKPVLSGRNAEAVKKLAAELGCEARPVALTDPKALAQALDGVRVVLHCAGPFIQTSAPMVEACLEKRAAYLDITGEIDVFEHLAQLGAKAAERGVTLLPGVGFDVVPTDCLAAHLSRRMPNAARLTLALRAVSQASRGTTRSALTMLQNGAWVRRNGTLVQVPLGSKSRDIDFGNGPRKVSIAPWGDVATAFHSTGIPNIETYLSVPKSAQWLQPFANVALPLLGTSLGKKAAEAYVRRLPEGPDETQRRTGKSLIYGEVEDVVGARLASRLTCPEAYGFTAITAVAAAQGVLAGKAKPGFQTPALAFGADWVLGFEGVSREDVEPQPR